MTPEEVWREHEKCVEYNVSIGLYDTIDKNNRFYNGRQWEGLTGCDSLDKPVFNILKDPIKLNSQIVYSDEITFELNTISPIIDWEQYRDVFKATEQEIKQIIENEKFNLKLQDALIQSQIEGDMCAYFYVDAADKIADDIIGTVKCEFIDGARVEFSNPISNEVEKQDHIIIVSFYTVNAAKKLAKDYGAGQYVIDTIKADTNITSMYNDDSTYNDNVVTVLTKLWKKDNYVYALKTTKDAIIKNEWNTGLNCYPIAFFNWENVKNCYHGNALVTGAIPNQIFINKTYSMAMLHARLTSFPVVIYDKNIISEWTNKVGGAIPVENNSGRLEEVARYMPVAEMSSQLMPLIQKIFDDTQRTTLGSNDALRGELNADNTSAIIALQKSSSIPLNNQRRSFKQFYEDCIRIMIDLIAISYGQRRSYYEDNGEKNTTTVDFSVLKNIRYKLNINVGSSAYWSEIDQITSSENLFKAGLITPIELIKRLPDSRVPNKQEIIDRMEKAEQQTQPMESAQETIDVEQLLQGV